MTQKAKKSVFVPRIIVFASLVIIVFLVVVGVISLQPKAELIVMVAPSEAVIRLDGKKIKNGARAVRAGRHKIEVSLEGFETKTQELEISKGETKAINLYLSDGDFSYYLSHEEDIELLRLIGDEEALKFVKEYRQAKTITELLPIKIIEDLGESSSTLELGKDCKRSYCLKITDSESNLKDKMLEKIKTLGYDPDDYEIQYEGDYEE